MFERARIVPGWPLALAVAVWTTAFAASGSDAQDASTARSTLGGVYTVDQADRGRKTFEATCLGGCHDRSTHSGIGFAVKWRGRLLSDLYVLIRDSMPDDNQGSLSAGEAIDIVAHVLRLNAMPAGEAELPTDVTVLKQIRIEFPSGEPPRLRGR